MIERVLSHPFFDLPCPKSLDRNAFAFGNIGLPDFTVADGAATLSGLTAASVARIVRLLLRAAEDLDRLRRWRAQSDLDAHAGRTACARDGRNGDAVGWSSQSIEAQAFAYLAVRTLNGLAITFPQTTGVKEPMRGGVIARP